MIRRGVTLIELITVLVVLGILAGVSALSARLGVAPMAANDQSALIRRARESAVRTGHPVTVTSDGGVAWSATAYPDGRVVTDAPFATDAQGKEPGRASR